MCGWTALGTPRWPGRRHRPSRPPSIPTPSGSFSRTRAIFRPGRLAFADTITGSEQQGWQAVKDGRGFALRVACARAQRTVDYLREVAPGREGGAYLRVLPRPGGGSVIVMTLPLIPGTDPETATATLRAELAALARLAGTA